MFLCGCKSCYSHLQNEGAELPVYKLPKGANTVVGHIMRSNSVVKLWRNASRITINPHSGFTTMLYQFKFILFTCMFTIRCRRLLRWDWSIQGDVTSSLQHTGTKLQSPSLFTDIFFQWCITTQSMHHTHTYIYNSDRSWIFFIVPFSYAIAYFQWEIIEN